MEQALQEVRMEVARLKNELNTARVAIRAECDTLRQLFTQAAGQQQHARSHLPAAWLLAAPLRPEDADQLQDLRPEAKNGTQQGGLDHATRTVPGEKGQGQRGRTPTGSPRPGPEITGRCRHAGATGGHRLGDASRLGASPPTDVRRYGCPFKT